jgi:hypothetical protein
MDQSAGDIGWRVADEEVIKQRKEMRKAERSEGEGESRESKQRMLERVTM